MVYLAPILYHFDQFVHFPEILHFRKISENLINREKIIPGVSEK